MVAIGFALTGSGRMDVDVSNHAQRAFLAHRPERAEVTPIETHDPGVETVRIEIVIEDKVDDPAPAVFLPPKQKGAALAAKVRTIVVDQSETFFNRIIPQEEQAVLIGILKRAYHRLREVEQ